MRDLLTHAALYPFRIQKRQLARRWEFMWLCILVISFAYERPLAYLTSYDRTNPRLFDAILALGILTVLPTLRRRIPMPRALKIWALLVLWFCICAVISSLAILPLEYARFSLFYASRYLLGLLTVYMVLQIPLSPRRKRVLHGLVVMGGVFVAFYCIPQYLSDSHVVVVTEELEVGVGAGRFTGPFGASYFELAQYAALSFAFALTFFLPLRGVFVRLFGLTVTAFVAWPLFFCGSRTGVGLAVVLLIALITYERRLRETGLVLGMILVGRFLLGGAGRVVQAIGSGTTLMRWRELGGSENVMYRMTAAISFPLSSYMHEKMLPLIGGGFYVAPRIVKGEMHYRVGYGYHSIFLFPFEQAGIIGLVLFLLFVFVVVKDTVAAWRVSGPTDRSFAAAVLAFFLATLVVGIGGHNFWQGFGSGNFNTCLIVLVCLGLIPTDHAIDLSSGTWSCVRPGRLSSRKGRRHWSPATDGGH